jgi:hypothetical protein
LEMADYPRAVEIDAEDTIVYINGGWAYCRKQEYGLAWADVRKAESLGTTVPAVFLKELREASGREN